MCGPGVLHFGEVSQAEMIAVPMTTNMNVLLQYWPIVGFVIFFVVAWLIAQLLIPKEVMPYERRPSLLTRSELHFLGTLQEAVQDDWIVTPMVRMADIIRVREGTKQRQGWQNKIQAKHIDFVLCDGGSMEIKLAIELDDRSHQRPDRIARDKFVDAAFDAADLPLLRVKVSRDYDAGALRSEIDATTA